MTRHHKSKLNLGRARRKVLCATIRRGHQSFHWRNRCGRLVMSAFTNCTIFLGAILMSAAATAQEIDHALWEERLLILIAPSADDPLALRQKQVLHNRRDAVEERRLRVIELYADGNDATGQDLSAPTQHAIRQRLGATPDSREMILVGLDGGMKRRAPLATPLSEFFRQIDGMPMRRQEIEQRQRNGLPTTEP